MIWQLHALARWTRDLCTDDPMAAALGLAVVLGAIGLLVLIADESRPWQVTLTCGTRDGRTGAEWRVRR